MCRSNVDYRMLEVTIPASHSYTGQRRKAEKPIDLCIHPIVKALNEGGVTTVASCCGHGKRPGEIVLEDGRTLFIWNTGDQP